MEAGALIGGGIGAVAGSQIAGRGNRTEGSIIGGVLGAVVGSQVGRASNDNCRSYDDRTYGYDAATLLRRRGDGLPYQPRP